MQSNPRFSGETCLILVISLCTGFRFWSPLHTHCQYFLIGGWYYNNWQANCQSTAKDEIEAAAKIMQFAHYYLDILHLMRNTRVTGNTKQKRRRDGNNTSTKCCTRSLLRPCLALYTVWWISTNLPNCQFFYELDIFTSLNAVCPNSGGRKSYTCKRNVEWFMCS